MEIEQLRAAGASTGARFPSVVDAVGIRTAQSELLGFQEFGCAGGAAWGGRVLGSLIVVWSTPLQRDCTAAHGHVRVQQAELLHPRVISRHQPLANVPAIADIRDQDAIRQAVCALLRQSDAVAHPSHHHGPAIDSVGDQFAVLQAEAPQ